MVELRLIDIVDLEFLQEFQDSFAEAVGLSCIIIDKEGNPITEPSRFTDFCMKFNRGCKKGNERCVRSDIRGSEESATTCMPVIYECENGLIDFATPIMLENKQIGAILGGQVLADVYEKDLYVEIAKEIGVNPNDYIEALKRVPVISTERIKSAAKLLYIVAQQISKMGYQNLTMSKLAKVLHENLLILIAASEELAASAIEVHETQSTLNKEIINVSRTSEQINTVLDAISFLVDDINLLGFNAAIEAARVGSIGSGFGVVAKEIRKLSTESKKTLNEIIYFTESIKVTVKNTVKIGNATFENTSEQTEAIHSMMESIEELSTIASKLNVIAI